MQENIRDKSLFYIFLHQSSRTIPTEPESTPAPPSSSLPNSLRIAQIRTIHKGDMGVPEYTEGNWTIPRWKYFESSHNEIPILHFLKSQDMIILIFQIFKIMYVFR